MAATPEEETQQVSGDSSGKAVLGGLVALGLIAMLANKDESSDSASTLDKNTTPAPVQQPAKQPNAPVIQQTVQQTVPITTGQTAQQTIQSTSAVTPSGLTADEERAVALMNADRAANGLPALKVNLKLTGLARNYAQDMINRKFFSHYDPEGSSPFDRMQQYGISYRYAGENLAINSSVAAAERAFMNSPGHRANILNPNYTQIGLGVRYSQSGSVYVVQEFISG
jgi:uncharacterized YkwD family protein